MSVTEKRNKVMENNTQLPNEVTTHEDEGTLLPTLDNCSLIDIDKIIEESDASNSAYGKDRIHRIEKNSFTNYADIKPKLVAVFVGTRIKTTEYGDIPELIFKNLFPRNIMKNVLVEKGEDDGEPEWNYEPSVLDCGEYFFCKGGRAKWLLLNKDLHIGTVLTIRSTGTRPIKKEPSKMAETFEFSVYNDTSLNKCGLGNTIASFPFLVNMINEVRDGIELDYTIYAANTPTRVTETLPRHPLQVEMFKYSPQLSPLLKRAKGTSFEKIFLSGKNTLGLPRLVVAGDKKLLEN